MTDLIKYFENKELAKGPVKLSEWQTIVNPNNFVSSYLEILKSDFKIKEPYYNRLNRFKEYLEENGI